MITNPFTGLDIFVYDLEVYPNYFLAKFLSESGKMYAFEYDDARSPQGLYELVAFLNRPNYALVGFNNNFYDDLVLKYILGQPLPFFIPQGEVLPPHQLSVTPYSIYQVGDGIITMGDSRPDWYWDIWKQPEPWERSLDIFKLQRPLQNGLKEVGAIMSWPTLIDLPVAPGTFLTHAQKRTTFDYCDNDIGITAEGWEKTIPDIKSRLVLEDRYPGIQLAHLHKAGVAEQLFLHLYSERSGVPLKLLKKYKPPSTYVKLAECIPELPFKNRTMIELVAFIKTLEGTDEELKKLIEGAPRAIIDTYEYKMALGGLHSVDKPLAKVAGDGWNLWDVDVTSYYPALQIILRLIPRQLQDIYLDILGETRDIRVTAKRNGEKSIADALKIVINSIFGKSGSEYSFMYDPTVKYSITLTGQLYLLYLIEQLTDSGIEVISANTDGVMSWIHDDQLETGRRIVKEWEEETRLEMEEEFYMKVFRRDVNNYLSVEMSGKSKSRGTFGKPHYALGKKRLMKQGRAPIIVTALHDYFLKGTPVMDTLLACTDVREFAHFFHAKKGWTLYYGEDPQQSTLRWYVAKESMLHITKRRPDGDKVRKISQENSQGAVLINDLPDSFPTDLDYNHYVALAHRVIDEIPL